MIERRHPLSFDDLDAVHVHSLHGTIGRSVYQRTQRVACRHHERACQVHNDEVSLHAGAQAADVLAPQRRRPANSGCVKQLRRAGCVDVLRRDTCQYRREAHLLDQVMRCHVRAKSDIDAGAPVAPEILKRLSIAGERRWTMRD
jgi:hypothetical protein